MSVEAKDSQQEQTGYSGADLAGELDRLSAENVPEGGVGAALASEPQQSATIEQAISPQDKIDAIMALRATEGLAPGSKERQVVIERAMKLGVLDGYTGTKYPKFPDTIHYK